MNIYITHVILLYGIEMWAPYSKLLAAAVVVVCALCVHVCVFWMVDTTAGLTATGVCRRCVLSKSRCETLNLRHVRLTDTGSRTPATGRPDVWWCVGP